MTSLSEVYEGNAREVSSLRRLYAGTGLVLVGSVLALLALVFAATDLFSALFVDHFAAVRVAGVLAGLGVPAALVGVFIVLPASNRVKAAAAIGASLCLLGVILFWHAYPDHWRGYGDNLTLHVSVVYLAGLFTALWCLFTGIVNFKTRNDPGGMLRMNVVRQGRTKIVEVEDKRGLGGIGLLGATPDGSVETQTNTSARSSRPARDRTQAKPSRPAGGPTPRATSDGGSTTRDISSPLEEATETTGPATGGEPKDRYCGNCSQFRYVRTDGGIAPYCSQFDERMDDMDACEEWTPNNR